ncbi:hypothetical protein STEG23_038328 [Scotinomys teguina]
MGELSITHLSYGVMGVDDGAANPVEFQETKCRWTLVPNSSIGRKAENPRHSCQRFSCNGREEELEWKLPDPNTKQSECRAECKTPKTLQSKVLFPEVLQNMDIKDQGAQMEPLLPTIEALRYEELTQFHIHNEYLAKVGKHFI